MHPNTTRRTLLGAPLAVAAAATLTPAAAETPKAARTQAVVDLFKVVTVKDEIVIALTDEDVVALGGDDISHIGRAIGATGELTVWRYAVRKAADGALELAPLHRVSLLGHESLRVEPYATPLRVAPIA